MTNAKILVVQDQDPATAGLEEGLDSLGYTVCATVSSAPRAVEEAAETHPDLALIDLGLGDSVEAAEQIGGRFGVAVIYLTDDVEEALSPRAQATHPLGYVLKPVEERQLHLNIQTALSTREREARHRETESRLQRSHRELGDRAQLMELALNSVPQGVIACNEDGEYLVYNASAERMVGEKMQEVELDHRSEGYGLYLPDGATLFPSAELPLARAILGESSDEVELCVRNSHVPEGLRVSISGRPFPYSIDGKRGGVIIFRDVTEEREESAKLEKTFSELESQTQLLETVFDSMDEAVVLCDSTGRLLLSNRRMEEILGIGMVSSGPDEWSSTYGAFHPDGETMLATDELPLVRALRGEVTNDMEVFVRNEEKPEGVYVSANARPLYSDGGQEIRAGLVVFSDITRHKDAEAKLSRTVARLRNQTQFMKTVFNSMSDAVIATDENGRYLFANYRAFEMGGRYIRSRSMDRWARDYGIHRPDGETLLPMDENPLVRAIRGEEMDGVELFLRNKSKPDGVHISVSSRPLRSRGGARTGGGVIVVRDLTHHKRTHAELQQTIAELQRQTQLMQTVFDSISDGVVVADAGGEFTIFNPSAERMVGVGMLEVPPDQWTDRYGIFYLDEKTHVPTHELPLLRAMAGDSVDEMELFIRNDKKPDGVYLSVSGRPLAGNPDQPAGGVVVFRDITGHKKAQAELSRTMEKLRNQSELMETTFNSISDGIVVADAQGEFLYVNPAAEQIVGMGPTDASPEEWSETYGTFYPDRETPVEAKDLPLLRAIFGGESTDDVDLFIRNAKRPDGVFIRVSGRPLLDEIGGIRGGVIAFRDATEQMLSEEALARAFAQGRLDMIDTILHNIGNAINSVTVGIRTVHQDLANNQALRRLRALADALEARRDDWIDYISNDPQGQKAMPFIIALAGDAASTNEGLLRTVERVRDRAEHIADIVRTQKALGNPSMDRKDLDLEEAMASAIRVLQDSLHKRGARIDCDCEEAPKVIRIQESQFHQMMVNLIKNAIEAVDELAASGRLEETPRIRIRAGVEGGFLQIDVSDNGIGIDMEQNSSRIFASGFSTKENGSGLGLHSVANFVIGSGGQIRPFSDGIGQGATMRVTLRLASVLPPAPQGTERGSR